jgi:hypothetical protein
VHINAAKSALTSAIKPDELSKQMLASSTTATSNLVFSAEQVTEQFKYILEHDTMQHELKRPRVSTKLKVRYHVDNEADELESVLGTAVYSKALEEAATQLLPASTTTTSYDEKKKKLAYVIMDTMDKALEKKLIDNGVQFRRALYRQDRIEGYKQILIPHQFSYCSSRVLDILSPVSSKMTLSEREAAYKSITKSASSPFLSKESVWKMLKEFIIDESTNSTNMMQKTTYYTLNAHHLEHSKTESEQFWKDEVNNAS